MMIFMAMTSYMWYGWDGAIAMLFFALGGMLVGYAVRGLVGRWQAEALEKQAQLKLSAAEAEAKTKMKEADILARAEIVKVKEEFEKSTKHRRAELEEIESRLSVREENMDKKAQVLDRKETVATEKHAAAVAAMADAEKRAAVVAAQESEVDRRLTKLGGMTRDEARRELTRLAEQDLRAEAGDMIRRIQEEAKETAEKRAGMIIATAMQRCVIAHVSELTSVTVALPSDDVKGRIIGREGRNIRALENATGVTMIIDDAPEYVTLSSFDPVRREVARMALEELILDGRIHPTHIEEAVARAQGKLEKVMMTASEEAAFEAHVSGLAADVTRMMGRLRFRTSFSQNVLGHAVEVALLSGMMAEELGLDGDIARRIGFLHDIGKALDHEQTGGHARIGADFLKAHGETAIVVNAVAAHHGDVPAESPYAPICAAADAVSSSRPGARAEATAVYVQRLEKIEKVVNSFKGVEKTFAVQAGREVRILVNPTMVSDNDVQVMAREIAKRISETMHFPGQIRVLVIRETRCIEYAQ